MPGKKKGPDGIIEGQINTNTVYSELNVKSVDRGKIKWKRKGGFHCWGEAQDLNYLEVSQIECNPPLNH